MKIKLSDHFTYKKILRATLSPILMMVFISIYSIVDGFFISNFSSASAFAGVNLIFPIVMIVGGTGFMLGTGGSALAAKYLGEKEDEKAHRVFTMIVISSIILGVFLSLIGFALIEPITLGLASFSSDTSQDMIDSAILYGRILMSGQTLFILQNVYQSFFIVNEKPGLGFAFSLASGITNMLLDFILVGLLPLGVVGAAIATIAGYLVGSLGPTLYFLLCKNNYIHFKKTKIEFKPLLQSCFNGSSEFVNNLSSSIVGIVFNMQLLKYFGENGVNAYGIIMYLGFVFTSVFLGYSIGVGPMISYHYGAKNKQELQNLLRKSMIIILITSLIMFLASFFGADLFASIFSKGDAKLHDLTVDAMKIYAPAFLLIGSSIFISSFFTALNNGLISALIAFLRTLVFQIGFAYLLPFIFNTGYGIFWAVFCCEVCSIILAFSFLVIKKKKYGY